MIVGIFLSVHHQSQAVKPGDVSTIQGESINGSEDQVEDVSLPTTEVSGAGFPALNRFDSSFPWELHLN